MQTCKLTSCVLVICLVLLGCSFIAGCSQKEPVSGIVKTDAGYVSGINQDGLWVYHGIPFAAPPTGDLRWRPPAPVKPWENVKETKAYSATCPQPGSPAPLNMSEDCLYLNVWTPARSEREKLPVMVFFFGGGFKEVAFSMPTYNGTTLAQKGVIVVTPNYRLGALGFLAHPELDNESPHNASGNYGIMDQQAALLWVQKNIDTFGGDPSRVTIFGQSAGAESVLIHLASPTSKGLFSQAIVESGPFWAHGAIINATHPKAFAEQSGIEYATSLGYPGPGAIAQMRRLSPEALISATPSPSPGFWTTHTVQFEPTIDGWVLPDTMDNQFLNHRENPVPLMIGNNANDGATLSAGANMTVPEYMDFIKGRFGKDADLVFAKYPARSTTEVQLRLAQIMTDYDFSNAVKFAAGSMSDINPDTYAYRYSYILPGQPNGAFHGSETLLLFGVQVPADPVVASNVVDIWTRFAKTGNPNGGMNVTWPEYTREAGRYLDINETLVVKGGGYPINSTVHTTLDRTIIPVPVPSASPKLHPYQVANFSGYGYGVWRFGDGLGYEKRLDLMPPGYAPAPVPAPARLLNFFTMTDIHITDKESPAQAVYYGYGWGMISGYSPAMLSTTQVLDAAVQTVNALNREKPFDFGIFLGDGINSGQHNELRWYIDVLDGRTIKPDSGVMDDPVPGPLNDYQDEYKAAGLDQTIKWYQVLGNHDHFWMGLFVPDDYIRSSLTGTTILNIGNVLTDKLRVKSRGFNMGAIDGRTPYGDITGAGPVGDFPRGPPTVPADPDRRFLSRTEWIGEFFNSSSGPAGHGFDQSDVTTGFACYSFEPKSDLPIRVIVLDDTQNDDNTVDGSSNGHGSLDQERYDWLVKELDKGQAEGRLMIIAAHIPVGVELESSGLGSLLTWDKYAAVSDTDLIARLHTYPNLLLWVSGHRHQNTITALKSPDPTRPELGFWEVETASLREFPQQFRTFEIVRNSDNTISIFATDVDPSVSDGAPAAGSRSYAIAAHQIFNLTAEPMPSGSYNAELVKQLSPEMQVKIQNYGTPAGS